MRTRTHLRRWGIAGKLAAASPQGVDYPNDSERVRAALAAFTRQMPNVPEQAYTFQGWRYQRAALNALTTRISQILTHELDVDTALAFVKKDVDLAIRASRH